MASKEELVRALEALLTPATRVDGSVSLDEAEKTLSLVRELKGKFQSLEQTLLQSPEGVAVQVDKEISEKKDRITRSRAKLDEANIQIEALTGKRKHEPVSYDFVPEGQKGKDEYNKQLNGFKSAFTDQIACIKNCVRRYTGRHEDTREAEIQRTDRQFKTAELNFLQSCVPIDLQAFHAKLHPVLDAKLEALRELRQLQLEGADIGEV